MITTMLSQPYHEPYGCLRCSTICSDFHWPVILPRPLLHLFVLRIRRWETILFHMVCNIGLPWPKHSKLHNLALIINLHSGATVNFVKRTVRWESVLFLRSNTSVPRGPSTQSFTLWQRSTCIPEAMKHCPVNFFFTIIFELSQAITLQDDAWMLGLCSPHIFIVYLMGLS